MDDAVDDGDDEPPTPGGDGGDDSDEFDRIVAEVRERVTPGAAERERLSAVVDELSARAREAIVALPVEADPLLVGSTARDTWLAGDRDVDLFVRFPPDLDRERLREYGLRVGHAVVPDGREEYAEHPYVTGTVDGFDVDCVPCFAVESASDTRSAVDRTPFHARYLDGRLGPDLAGDVRVCKTLLKAVGAYGSDLRTRGFSGYLTELLVVEYGGFRPLLVTAADWSPPVRLDPAGHGERSFDDPLTVVDPTDPERNVAAVCSATNLARLVHHARALLSDPSVDRFESRAPEPLDAAAVREHVRARGTHPVAVRFDAPDVVDDQLYPQLDRSLSGVRDELDRRGFDPLRAARFADGSAVLFVECGVAERPAVERHEGPPIGVREHAESFYEEYVDAGTDAGVYGPFLDGDRYVVERDRAVTTPGELLASDAIFDVSLGSHVESALSDGYETLVGESVAALAGEFGVELARYFDPWP